MRAVTPISRPGEGRRDTGHQGGGHPLPSRALRYFYSSSHNYHVLPYSNGCYCSTCGISPPRLTVLQRQDRSRTCVYTLKIPSTVLVHNSGLLYETSPTLIYCYLLLPSVPGKHDSKNDCPTNVQWKEG